ncbi:DUF58 domain-containing protein [Tamlana sp. 2_MG-2023]|uniref:DUF58 domain-containing protein n=1 Tax=unclassified Tamlana TaxID=2614803 RepID=UPI0026E2D3AB|nr:MULTISPECIES: DUF58 domain-containing protein [unclassified Tamlana]MDO6761393.1 DUF58 domain-containing protein [Tamlana sp. 2_MG-2023]MDO6791993.1 DUF58 domain-containing protein [Tamlana sp. 1_MG-2023]
MKSPKPIDNTNVFLTLEHLLKFELISSIINFGSGKQKSNSVLSGRYASKLRGRGLDFEESRPYVLGDDIRKIDWKVTAKTGGTHTKIFTEEKEKPAFIYVDQTASMGFGSQKKTKSVVAGELASILAHKIKKGGDRVGGMINSGKTYEVVTPKRDPRNIIYFLQKIIEANQKIYTQEPFEFEDNLTEIISKINNIVTHDYVVFIISDFRRYSASVVQYLSQLALHNDLVLIKVYDDMEEQFPDEKFTITNTTHQINLNGKNKKLNKELKDTFETDYKNFKAELEKYQINIFKVNTTDPVEDQLIDVFSNYNR